MGGIMYWTTRKVEQGILEIMEVLGIDRMPTRTEIVKVKGGGLVQAILRMGGAKVVAETIGVKMSQRQGNPVKVYVYDENYNLLREYESTREASEGEMIGRYRIDNCTHDAIEYVEKDSKKYIFSFKKNLKKEDRKLIKRKYVNSKEIFQYTEDKVLVAKYNSINEASEKTGLKKSSIQSVCNRGNAVTLKGYIFSYMPLEELKPKENEIVFKCENRACLLNRGGRCISEHITTEKADCASKNKVTSKQNKSKISDRFKMCYEG